MSFNREAAKHISALISGEVDLIMGAVTDPALVSEFKSMTISELEGTIKMIENIIEEKKSKFEDRKIVGALVSVNKNSTMYRSFQGKVLRIEEINETAAVLKDMKDGSIMQMRKDNIDVIVDPDGGKDEDQQ